MAPSSLKHCRLRRHLLPSRVLPHRSSALQKSWPEDAALSDFFFSLLNAIMENGPGFGVLGFPMRRKVTTGNPDWSQRELLPREGACVSAM